MAGTSADKTQEDAATSIGIAIGGGTVVLATLAAGLVYVSKQTAPGITVASVAPTGEYLSLSQYSSQFTAELASAAVPAPAITE